MTWAKLDDDFPNHPKVTDLSDGAFRLHVTAICYAAKWNTFGEITPKAFRTLGGRQKFADELHDANLWETTSRGGWAIHDFEVYNPPRNPQTAAELSAQRAAAGRQGGIASAEARRSKRASKIEANDEANLLRASEAPSRPVPSPETYNPSGYASLSAAEREIADTALSKLPLQYQRDELAIDELGQFARDFAGRPHVHIELANAIAKCRQNGQLCFAGNLRKYMPGGPSGNGNRNGHRSNRQPNVTVAGDAGGPGRTPDLVG